MKPTTREDLIRALIAEEESDIESLMRQLERKREFVDSLKGRLGEPMPPATSPTATSKPSANGTHRATIAITPRKSPQTPSKGSLTESIVNLLRENGGPMQAAEIARTLGERGVTTKSRNGLLPMVISTLVRRKKQFRNVSRGIYELRTAVQNTNGG